MPTDSQLLAEYVDRQSEAAFAQLVERHVALVYSSALRQVGDAQLAGEITQAVFIILARKAAGLGAHTVLPGWLCRTAHFAARDALKTERRRQQREQEAYMQSQLDQPADSSRPGETTADAWLQIAPLLDAAVAQLRAADRNAIVLRIYEQRPLDEVGAALGIGADAAQKRVTRALDKLRAKLVKQGMTLTVTVIAGAVAANSVQAAPVTLVQTISVVAVAKGAAAGTATLTIVKGALKFMAWTKVQTAVIAGVVVLLAAGTTTVLIEKTRAERVSGLLDQNYKSALDVLNAQINNTRAELSPGLTNEFEQSIAARLKTIQQEVSQNITAEYKSARMAKLILELSENVMTLPYRKIPEDVQQRKEAQQQYAAALGRFEAAMPDKTRQLNEMSKTTIVGPLRQELTDVQHDIFRPGYGKPLSEQENVELNRILDGVLQAAANLPPALDKKGLGTSGLFEASKVAIDGRKAVDEFLLRHETDLTTSLSCVVAIKKFYSGISTLEQTVDRESKKATEIEINAVEERANQQEEKDLRENNPTNIAAQARAAAKEK